MVRSRGCDQQSITAEDRRYGYSRRIATCRGVPEGLAAHPKATVPLSCMLLVILVQAIGRKGWPILCIMCALDEELHAAVLEDAMHCPAHMVP